MKRCNRRLVALPGPFGGHDDHCEAEFVDGPMLWTWCGCGRREAAAQAAAEQPCGPHGVIGLCVKCLIIIVDV